MSRRLRGKRNARANRVHDLWPETALRALGEDSAFDCDWGYCDEEAVAERYTSDHGWLPVCAQHADAPVPTATVPLRAAVDGLPDATGASPRGGSPASPAVEPQRLRLPRPPAAAGQL